MFLITDGSIAPTLLGSLVEDLGVRELDEDHAVLQDQSLVGVKQNLLAMTKMLSGVHCLSLRRSIKEPLAHPSDIVDDLRFVCKFNTLQDGSR